MILDKLSFRLCLFPKVFRQRPSTPRDAEHILQRLERLVRQPCDPGIGMASVNLALAAVNGRNASAEAPTYLSL